MLFIVYFSNKGIKGRTISPPRKIPKAASLKLGSIIEAIKSGSPPPVLGLAISPDSWTNQRKFILNWETPVWGVGRDLLGSVIQLYDGFDTKSDFYPFPTGDTLTTMEVEVPEAGEFEVSVWLMDEFGNENVDSARSVTA